MILWIRHLHMHDKDHCGMQREQVTGILVVVCVWLYIFIVSIAHHSIIFRYDAALKTTDEAVSSNNRILQYRR